MNGKRVVFVTRRFWPVWDGASRTIGLLASALVERGNQATVLTTLGHPQWPAKISWRGISVVRLLRDPRRRWADFHHMRRVARWFRARRADYDLICVSGLRHDAYAVLSAVDRNTPVVLRAESAGLLGDCRWQLDARGGRRIKRRTMKAAAFVGTSNLAHEELIAAGYPRDRVHYIPNGVSAGPPRDAASRAAARDGLGVDYVALRLPEAAPLVLCIGRLDRGKGLLILLDAWEKVAAARRDAQLWLVGRGPNRDDFQERIDSRHLHGRITMVGQFDDVEALLLAADLLVSPAPEGDLSVALLEAMAAGLPVVAADTRDARTAIEPDREGLLVRPGDTAALATAMTRLLDRSDVANKLGAAAKERVEREFSAEKMLDAHVMLFSKIMNQ